MKKFILSTIVMVSFGAYVVWQNTGNASDNLPIPNLNDNQNTPESVAITPTPTYATPTPKTSKNPSPTPKPIVEPPKKTGIYNDGTYTGSSVDAYYGYVQVKAVITNGQLSDITFLDYPHDRGTSIRINSEALPILRSEAIKAQSANVNTVSGATDSSGAFRASLSSALSQAKA